MFTKEEIRELFAESNKAIAQTNKAIDRLAARQEKTEQSIDRLAERIDGLAERQEKTDEQLAKTDAQIARTAAKLDKMSDMYGGLSNNVGKSTEELFFNTLHEAPVLKGIQFDKVQRNWHETVGKLQDEFDIVMLNGSSIFIIEAKFSANPSDVEKLLTTKQENFNILFPKYKDYDQHWGLAATIISKKLRKMAVANGLTVLQHKGGLIQHNP